MFSRLLLIASVMGLYASTVPAADNPPPVGRTPFLVLDGLLYAGKPDLGSLGMIPIRGINPPPSANRPSDGVDEAKVRATLQPVLGYRGFVYLDYEIWPTFRASPAEVSESIAKLSQVVQIAHQTLPGAKVGFYDLIPCWTYWDLMKNDPARIKEWKDCNVRIRELAGHVDIVMPSLYTFYNDPQGWDIFAAAMLKEARQYGKPVYAFLWPEYHVSNRLLKGKNLPGNFWRHELEFCRTRADGVVIWGGYQKPWDENAEWWIETKGFLASLQSR